MKTNLKDVSLYLLLFFSTKDTSHMGPEGVLNWKKTPIFFVDAKRSQIAQEFQKHKS